MTSQIFKLKVPNKEFFEFLETVCIKDSKKYIFNLESFKKGNYLETISKFMEFCKPYYHLSKQKYLERKMTYNTFTTILRQICKFNNITYTTEIKYDKSKYDIVYYIYYSLVT
jgi:hypothetical protein